MDSANARMQHTAASLRNTGINALGAVPWGTHCCQFYHTRQDLLDVLVPYFRAGLHDDEHCVWVVAHPLDVPAAKAALGSAIPEFDQCLARGQGH